ncbi:hypothetical protein CSA17_02805, partial [bacterium DOLJORAL78_65_58]
MAITPQQTLFAITEAHPETIAVFVAQGYENMGDADKRRTQGKMVTLAQAVQARGKDLASFTALLENAVREAGATPDLTLAEDADESQVFPSEGDIRVAGLLPCPVRIPLLEAFDKVVAEV